MTLGVLGFDDGSPDGHDPLQVAREIARRDDVLSPNGQALDAGGVSTRREAVDSTNAGAQLEAGGVRVGDRLVGFDEIVDAAGESTPEGLRAEGSEHGDVRSLAFNVHAVRVAVDVETGTVRVLQSVHAADAGFVMNPAQCRGQIEGGVAQGYGSVSPGGEFKLQGRSKNTGPRDLSYIGMLIGNSGSGTFQADGGCSGTFTARRR